jgi:hypothetical protein
VPSKSDFKTFNIDNITDIIEDSKEAKNKIYEFKNKEL